MCCVKKDHRTRSWRESWLRPLSYNPFCNIANSIEFKILYHVRQPPRSEPHTRAAYSIVSQVISKSYRRFADEARSQSPSRRSFKNPLKIIFQPSTIFLDPSKNIVTRFAGELLFLSFYVHPSRVKVWKIFFSRQWNGSSLRNHPLTITQLILKKKNITNNTCIYVLYAIAK